MLVDDFFTYIHPLCPFPHKPKFQQRFVKREYQTNPEFLALLSSMIAALVASFPRAVRSNLQGQQANGVYVGATAMVDKCTKIVREARGFDWPNKQWTVEDAATSYFMALAAGYTEQQKAFRYWMRDTLGIMSELGYDKPTFGNDPSSPDQLSFDHIDDQIGKRIFWCLFFSVR
jgi:hypothetical protein